MSYLKRVLLILVSAVFIWSCRTAQTGSRASEPAGRNTGIQETIAIPPLPGTAHILVLPKPEMPVVAYKDVLTIAGVGDIMMGTNFPDASYLPPKDFNPLQHVSHILADADITFGNLEGVILNEGGNPKECRNPDLCYLFRSPEYVAGYLKEAGFDLLSLANNHAGDFGAPGRANTMRVLDSLNMGYAGLESCPYAVWESAGIRYGLAAFAPNSGTISLHDIDRALGIVAHLDSTCHIVIASFHGGAEGKEHEHITRAREYFHGEDRGDVYAFSRLLIDAGADLVFGHGPHVTRAVDLYRNRFIAYSLGNFCTYARFNLKGPNGIAPIVKITVRRDGAFVCGSILPVRQTGLGVPEPDKEMLVIKKIRALSENDVPDLAIDIDALGNINYLDRDF